MPTGRIQAERVARLWANTIADKDLWARASEAIIQRLYETIPLADCVALDLGANTGRHLFPLAQAVGPKGKVHAFEAVPRLFDQLTEQVKTRALAHIVLHHCAISNISGGSVQFFVNEDHHAFSTLTSKHRAESDRWVAIEVPRATLNDFDFAAPVAFVKMDIEGGEYDALRGASKLLSGDRPVIALEDGRGASMAAFGYTSKEYYGLFDSYDYVLMDFFGIRVDSRMDRHNGPWNFFAAPKEQFEEVRDYVVAATCDELLSRLHPAPAKP